MKPWQDQVKTSIDSDGNLSFDWAESDSLRELAKSLIRGGRGGVLRASGQTRARVWTHVAFEANVSVSWFSFTRFCYSSNVCTAKEPKKNLPMHYAGNVCNANIARKFHAGHHILVWARMFEFTLILLLIWLSLGDCFSNANKFFELFFLEKKSIDRMPRGRYSRDSHYTRLTLRT